MSQTTRGERVFKVVGQRPLRPDGVEKVTGRALYGADLSVPGMLVGHVLRSPHPHARIVRIDTRAAQALPGVKAVVTVDDFATPDDVETRDVLHNCIANDKVLYDGHAVAAVAAIDHKRAREALALIEVDYDRLPHVIDVDEAMRPDAVVLHHGRSDESVPSGFSENVTGYCQFGHGDVEAGLANADLVITRRFTTAAAHQGYIEPHACLASVQTDGSAELWCTTQGPFMVRRLCAALLGLKVGQLRVTPSEIGGGFGGKTTVFIEPVALALARKAGRAVKMVMSREEVFRASGPTMSASTEITIGMSRDGRMTAGRAVLRYQNGAFPAASASYGAMAAFAAYDLEAVESHGYDVVTNRPKQAAYRAPGAPMAVFGVECVVDELSQRLGLDPLEVRLTNAARKGSRAAYGPTFDDIGLVAALNAAKSHPHYTAPIAPGTGRGVACGFWFNFGGDTSVSMSLNADGTVTVTEGNPDIGGSRASISQMAAEELGIAYTDVRTVVADTGSIGYNDVTDGSRVTFAVGLATIEAARAMIDELRLRAARIWGIDVQAVHWRDGQAVPAGGNAGEFTPLTLPEIAALTSQTGGPIAGHREVNAEGAGVSFGVHLADVAVDPLTGLARVVRYTAVQDAGKAVHPAYVEGQMQGGAVQGIGWALNEEYVYGGDGRLQNPGFLDYRMPVASDLPMIDTVIVEVPNPGHPYGVRGVGETSIVPPLAAVTNAVSAAIGLRMSELPLSPPRIVAALGARDA